MKLSSPISVADIAALINAEIIGDANALVHGINEIHKVTNGDLTFVDHPKYYDKALQSAATFVIINQKMDAPAGKTLFYHADPFEAISAFVPLKQPLKVSLTLPLSEKERRSNRMYLLETMLK